MARRSVAAVYAGGFLGPFSASLSSAILPELGAAFGISQEAAAWAVPAYLVPFATLMLVSGAIGRRLGVSRTNTTAFALLIGTSLMSAMSPNWHMFLAFQALCGALNAFTTPLLLATLGTITPGERLGRSLGMFAALQSLGLLAGPLASGLAATHSWRLAYAFVAVGGAAMLVAGLPRVPADNQPWGVLFSYLSVRWTHVLASVVFLAGASVNGLTPIVVLHSVDQWRLDSVGRGLLVMSGGVAAALVSRPVGALVDRLGTRRIVMWAIFSAILVVAPAPLMPSVWLFLPFWLLATAAYQVAIISLMTELMRRPGATSSISVFQGARFGGVALAPIASVPVYEYGVGWVFSLSVFRLLLALVLTPAVVGRPQHPTSVGARSTARKDRR